MRVEPKAIVRRLNSTCTAFLEAAVADVFGTLSVAVVITRTHAAATPSAWAATARTFVWSPCPISVPL